MHHRQQAATTAVTKIIAIYATSLVLQNRTHWQLCGNRIGKMSLSITNNSALTTTKSTSGLKIIAPTVLNNRTLVNRISKIADTTQEQQQE